MPCAPHAPRSGQVACQGLIRVVHEFEFLNVPGCLSQVDVVGIDCSTRDRLRFNAITLAQSCGPDSGRVLAIVAD